MENKRYSVLIIDDAEKNLQVLGSLLDSRGVSIFLAMNGKQGIMIAEKKTPDLILLDIAMPEMDGYDVIKILKEKEQTNGIPVIFLTAKTEQTDKLKGFALGGVDYITKPFNKEELISRVFTHLELKKARDVIEEQNIKLELQNKKILEYTENVENLNKKLEHQNNELEELNATKDKFFSLVSHDLKSPINTLKTFTGFLKGRIDHLSKEKLVEFVDSMHEEMVTADSFLSDLLEWAKNQMNKIDFYPKELCIKKIVKSNKDLVYKTALLKNIEISTQLDEGIVIADEGMINTVLRNLLTNAIKFTNRNGKINISTHLLEKKMVEIKVSDNGVGMREKKIKELFALETMNSYRGTDGESGTGLGLILCKDFMERNEGKISIESQEGKGTTVSISLPGHFT